MESFGAPNRFKKKKAWDPSRRQRTVDGQRFITPLAEGSPLTSKTLQNIDSIFKSYEIIEKLEAGTFEGLEVQVPVEFQSVVKRMADLTKKRQSASDNQVTKKGFHSGFCMLRESPFKLRSSPFKPPLKALTIDLDFADNWLQPVERCGPVETDRLANR